MALTERVARILCEEDGHDPDGLSRARVVSQSPMWRAYEERAGAAARRQRGCRGRYRGAGAIAASISNHSEDARSSSVPRAIAVDLRKRRRLLYGSADGPALIRRDIRQRIFGGFQKGCDLAHAALLRLLHDGYHRVGLWEAGR
jgi:hypothetical protein